MKVIVCGSRSWDDMLRIVDRLGRLPAGSTIIHGGAHGADTIAAHTASLLGLRQDVHYAQWEKLGKRAGIIRNLEMLELCPELVLAFWDGESRGTKHMIDEARKRGIPVEVIRDEHVQPPQDPGWRHAGRKYRSMKR